MTGDLHRAVAVPPEATYPLRRDVLRREPTPAEVAGELDGWGHYAVVIDAVVVATGVTHPQASHEVLKVRTNAARTNAWRIIGMAVDSHHRRLGYGGLVLHALLTHARDHGGHYVWCNARADAAPFYRQNGFEPHLSQRCDPLAGNQLLMSRQL